MLRTLAEKDRMKELFREQDITRVTYWGSVLEAAGIPTHIRNQYLTGSGLTEIPIAEFFPALCVINEDDYERAMETIRRTREENEKGSETEIACPSCSELNPGNFEVCWSCGESLQNSRSS